MGGIVELSLFATIFKTNIGIYIKNDENDNIYHYYTIIWECDDNDNNLLIRYENGNRFYI